MKKNADQQVTEHSVPSNISNEMQDQAWKDFNLRGPKILVDSDALGQLELRADNECQGFCSDETQVTMACIACLDGRSTAKPELFRDALGDDFKVISVPKGRGIAVAEDLKKIIITSDLVVVCCADLAEALMRMRQKEGNVHTMDQVRVMWEKVQPEKFRDAIKTFTHESTSLEQDHITYEIMRQLCIATALARKD